MIDFTFTKITCIPAGFIVMTIGMYFNIMLLCTFGSIALVAALLPRKYYEYNSYN